MAKKKKNAIPESGAETPVTSSTSSSSSHPVILPAVSIALVGHVDHGKTTLVKSLSGKWTDTHSEELKRGITIRLGYADFSIYKCASCKDPESYSLTEKCASCGGTAELQRAVSLVDAPGHESLMATMLCGANITDGAILLVSAREQCPQPQTKEHLMALQIIGLKNIIVVQNKVDLVSKDRAEQNYNEIKEFLKGTPYEGAPIIPISARHSVNIDVLLDAIQKYIPTPVRDQTKSPLFFVARSFDINKPGSVPENMTGGVLGGAMKQGKLASGQKITILPGYEVEEKNQKVWKPLSSIIVTIMAAGATTSEATPGGSLGIMTELDPAIVKSDKLVGAVAGIEGKMPGVLSKFALDVHLLERVVGVKDQLVVEPIKLGEPLMLNVNAAATVGLVRDLSKGLVRCDLKRPVCADIGSRVTISRMLGQRWRLIGYGIVKV